jgi:hypothetical protein
VRPVRGPGSPGVLFVEGERFNVSRFYAPPPAPNITPQPGDIISYDQNGMPLISRPVGVLSSSDVKHGVPGSKTLVKETHTETDGYVEISPYQLALEAQKGAVAAEAQLEADVAMLKSINDDRKRFNDVIMAVAATSAAHPKTGAMACWRKMAPPRGRLRSPPNRPSPKWCRSRTTPHSRRWASESGLSNRRKSTWTPDRSSTSFRFGSCQNSMTAAALALNENIGGHLGALSLRVIG